MLNKRSISLVVMTFGVLAALALSLRGNVTVRAASSGSGPQAVQSEQTAKTADQEFKNIQVLKDVPASRLLETMNFFAASLGVDCRFCHVNPFEKDDKREKQTARKMIQMVRSINQESFGGRTVVTCASCHQGHQEPAAVPPLGDLEQPARIPPKQGEQMPTLDQVLDRYTEAIGGKAALGKVTSRSIKGYVEIPNRGKLDVEIFQKAPDKYAAVETTEMGPAYMGFDGSKGWQREAGAQGHFHELAGAELLRMRRDAAFYLGLDLKDRFPQARVAGKAKLGDRETIVLAGRTQDGNQERLFFDAKTGLLARVYTLAATPFGPLPESLDLDDYKEVDGVKVPFIARDTGSGYRFVLHVSEVKNNVAVDDSRFSGPPTAK
jgi:hypothetical protein